jgi:hypothetical protein
LPNTQKPTLGQGVLAPVREDLLNRVDFDSKEQIKGTDGRRNVRRRSKEPIRDATLGGDQRSRTETQRQEEIKGAEQRRNVRGDQRSQIRAATKKPAIRGPTKIKYQHGSEERTL